MKTAQVDWVGRTVDGCLIEELAGEGAFSWVYKAVSPGGSGAAAVKIAKPYELVGSFDKTPWLPTEARIFITGGTMTVHPDAVQLLGLQSLKMQESRDPALPRVDSLVMEADDCFCRMEFLEGQTLRQVMTGGPVSIELLLELVQVVERLSGNDNFEYHGDLKPENIMVTPAGMKLIDPGHFGPLDCLEGNFDRCAITTPAYYPLLTPDDLFALGIILWEVACKRHPLEGGGYSEVIDKSGLGDELISWVRQGELVGQYFLGGILETGRPSEIRPELPAALEPVLLKALRLRITDENKIDKDKGFESLTAMADAMKELLALGVAEL